MYVSLNAYTHTHTLTNIHKHTYTHTNLHRQLPTQTQRHMKTHTHKQTPTHPVLGISCLSICISMGSGMTKLHLRGKHLGTRASAPGHHGLEQLPRLNQGAHLILFHAPNLYRGSGKWGWGGASKRWDRIRRGQERVVSYTMPSVSPKAIPLPAGQSS